MTYTATLYSKSIDRYEIDCNSAIYWEGDLADYITQVWKYYNEKYKVNDFIIVSIILREG